MILRKPYAIFIKLFRPMHFVITILLAIISYKFYDIYLFFRGYVRTGHFSDIRDITTYYVNGSFYLCFVLLILLFGLIIALFLYKKKSITSYVILLCTQVVSLIFAVTIKKNLVLLNTLSINIRKAAIIRDVSIILSVFYTILLIWMAFRALGFNLKQFEFNKDLKELQIESNDNEEFELAVDIDKNDVKTRWNKFKRLSKYYVSEYRKILTIIAVCLLVIGAFACFVAYLNSETLFSENVEISPDNYKFKFKVVDSYLLDKDYKGNSIGDDEYKYLVVRYELTNKITNDFVFDLTTAVLNTNKSYANIMTMYDSFRDIGIGYNGQVIKPGVTGEFIMVFPIDINDNSSKYILRVFDGNDKFAISLNPKKLNKVHDNSSVSLNEELNITNSILPNITFKVEEYKIDNKMILNNKGIAYTFVPINKNRTVLMIKYSYKMEESNIYKMSGKMFLSSYSKVEVEINSKKVELDVIDKTPSLFANVALFELDSKINDANTVALVFSIRNEKYYYYLKK